MHTLEDFLFVSNLCNDIYFFVLCVLCYYDTVLNVSKSKSAEVTNSLLYICWKCLRVLRFVSHKHNWFQFSRYTKRGKNECHLYEVGGTVEHKAKSYSISFVIIRFHTFFRYRFFSIFILKFYAIWTFDTVCNTQNTQYHIVFQRVNWFFRHCLFYFFHFHPAFPLSTTLLYIETVKSGAKIAKILLEKKRKWKNVHF